MVAVLAVVAPLLLLAVLKARRQHLELLQRMLPGKVIRSLHRVRRLRRVPRTMRQAHAGGSRPQRMPKNLV